LNNPPHPPDSSKTSRSDHPSGVAQSKKKSPFAILNVRLFIAFRVFFNSRFYYPIFTILFLDFGLTLAQFALLNVAWAATIVILEVPSGALADTIGRRNLLVSAGLLMVLEMGLLCFVPRGNPNLLFVVFMVNRVLSGTAEAAASGADEAIAYDTLKIEGDIEDWGRVLEVQMRVKALAYIVAMSLGAAAYDPVLMQRISDLLGLNVVLTQGITMRFPLFLTLAMAVMTLLAALRMREGSGIVDQTGELSAGRGKSMTQSFKLTIQAGKWILKTPFALVIITAGLLFDSIIRMVMTLSSQYYRLIELPEASFGLIGSLMAIMGLFIPRIALNLTKDHSEAFNLGVTAALTLIGLTGLSFCLPIIGLLPMMLLVSAMYLTGFFLSHYLNRITSSHQRATVLSFKGLSYNLGYGLIGLGYALLLALTRPGIKQIHTGLGGEAIENLVFVDSLAWFPWFFLLALAGLLVFSRRQLRNVA
jgi:MFS family permease